MSTVSKSVGTFTAIHVAAIAAIVMVKLRAAFDQVTLVSFACCAQMGTVP